MYNYVYVCIVDNEKYCSIFPPFFHTAPIVLCTYSIDMYTTAAQDNQLYASSATSLLSICIDRSLFKSVPFSPMSSFSIIVLS